jgi:hypothetical protein
MHDPLLGGGGHTAGSDSVEPTSYHIGIRGGGFYVQQGKKSLRSVNRALTL